VDSSFLVPPPYAHTQNLVFVRTRSMSVPVGLHLRPPLVPLVPKLHLRTLLSPKLSFIHIPRKCAKPLPRPRDKLPPTKRIAQKKPRDQEAKNQDQNPSLPPVHHRVHPPSPVPAAPLLLPNASGPSAEKTSFRANPVATETVGSQPRSRWSQARFPKRLPGTRRRRHEHKSTAFPSQRNFFSLSTLHALQLSCGSPRQVARPFASVDREKAVGFHRDEFARGRTRPPRRPERLRKGFRSSAHPARSDTTRSFWSFPAIAHEAKHPGLPAAALRNQNAQPGTSGGSLAVSPSLHFFAVEGPKQLASSAHPPTKRSSRKSTGFTRNG